jgi:hypothetical protein
LLILAEARRVALTISQQVVTETERALARKAPRALPDYRELLRRSVLRIVRDPTVSQVATQAGIISHQADVPIVVAAMDARVDFLVTLNRRHFLDDPGVAERSGLRIGTPGDALAWVRREMETGQRGTQ